MTLTEEEARKKWCPMVRYTVAAHGEPFSNMPNEKAQTCAASLCMAWRWDKAESSDLHSQWMMREPVALTPQDHAQIHGSAPAPVGHCGFAGAP